MNYQTNDEGFSLIEMMIALTILAVFIGSFVFSQGQNIHDSIMIDEELKMQTLASLAMEKLLADPPPLNESLTLTKERKGFEDPLYSDYEFITEFKKFTIPNLFSQAGGPDQDSQDSSSGQVLGGQTQQIIYDNIKRNVERILWQVKITVVNKITGVQYPLSTWIRAREQRVILEI